MTVKEIYADYKPMLGREITLGGWVRTVRDNKNLGFLELNDGTFFKSVQVVFDSGLENFGEAVKLGAGAAVTVTGTLVESPGGKQMFEITASAIHVERDSPSDYPLQKKRHTVEYLRTIAHLRPRTNLFSAVFRVRSLISFAIHKFFNERGFVYVHTPIITGSDCEGAGEMFRVTTLDPAGPPRDAAGNVNYGEDFFGRETNLTVSGQLSAEAFAMAFRNVYTFGPTFRAENSNTARHAAEFWMVEPEIAFADLRDNMRLAEDMLKYVIRYVLENAPEEMEFFSNFVDKGLLERLSNLLGADFGVITYTEAVRELEACGEKFEYPVKWGIDLQTEHERFLTEKIYGKPVFLIDYPQEIKAFYMRLNEDGKTVAAMDLLVPGVGEIIGGSQREERPDYLRRALEKFGLKEEDYWWYMDLRRFGGVRHAGFGLGLERCAMYLTGVANIRDVLPFPRTVKNAEF
ncbi:MAG: asparagine--tRNA ligase [Clostridiales bacterium]|jgi:asparaginyl-tRNA synthetase|nr:asparagine--tRNA ligase [Clostridiales bacterium]